MGCLFRCSVGSGFELVHNVASNCLIKLATSGPETIHLSKAEGFSVRPIAPPLVLTTAFIIAHELGPGQWQKMSAVSYLRQTYHTETRSTHLDVILAMQACHAHELTPNMHSYCDSI